MICQTGVMINEPLQVASVSALFSLYLERSLNSVRSRLSMKRFLFSSEYFARSLWSLDEGKPNKKKREITMLDKGSGYERN